jgi:3-oxoacyl-[acyl-carrier-protein] synthase III
MESTFIVANGFYVPNERITNADLERLVSTSAGWIDRHLGINERRKAAHDETTARLGALALEAALRSSDWEKKSIDLLICATSTPDKILPATACQIGKELGIDPVSFDVGAACSAFPYAIAVADAMLSTSRFERAAVVFSECYTRFTDYTDRETCVFFGDSAAGMLLERGRATRGLQLIDTLLFNRNDGADTVETPTRGYFRQDGPAVKEAALRGFEDAARGLLQRNRMSVSDLKAFVGHQANYRVLEVVCQRLGITAAQHWHNVRDFGNQGGAGSATTLSQHLQLRGNELRDGDHILVATFGAGFTIGASLFRWGNGKHA